MAPTQIKDVSAFILQDLNISHPDIKQGSKAFVVLAKQSWCGYCTKFWPDYERQSELLDKQRIQTLYIEGTQSPEILDQWKELVFPIFQIQGFPTLIVFNSQGRYVGEVAERTDIAKSISSMAI